MKSEQIDRNLTDLFNKSNSEQLTVCQYTHYIRVRNHVT